MSTAIISFFFGALGSGLLMGGLVKATAGGTPPRLNLVSSETALLAKEPRVSRVFAFLSTIGVVATLLSGWIVTYEIVTPGGGGVYWRFPFAWKSIQSWIGTYYGFQYGWFWFIADVLIYLAAAYFALYFVWANSTGNKKAVMRRVLESKRSILLLSTATILLFIADLVYDYLYLWHLWQ